MLPVDMRPVAQKCLCLSPLMSTLQYTGRYQIVLPFTRRFCDEGKLRGADLESGSSLFHFLARGGEHVLKLYRKIFLADMKNVPVWCGPSLTLVTSHFRNILRGQCFRRNLKH